MKVVFKIIKTNSGNDTYFENLSSGLEKTGVKTEIVYLNKIYQYLPFLLKFNNKHKQGDIVHTNVEYGWALKEKNTPLFVTLHHNVFDKNYYKYTSIFQKIYYLLILKPNTRKTLDVADKIIAVSNFTKKSFIKEYGSFEINVIHNFIETEKFKPIHFPQTGNTFKLLFVGNLIKRKGADLLPGIMTKLGSKYTLRFTSGLRTDVPSNFDLNNMVPLGKLTNKGLIAEYNRCDAFLFPTRLEGFGYTVAEAMSCGKPVVTSNCSSLPEILVNNVNGYLCEVGNVEDIVRKIIVLRNKLKKGHKYKIKNRARILNLFSKLKILKKYKDLYIKQA